MLTSVVSIGFTVLIVFIIIFVLYRKLINKKTPTVHYTPFDEITGQSPVKFHEEQQTLAEEFEQGEGKDRKK
ncbi:DUF3951 domain-containing protein [Metabacillus litoralis]|uniref:DUF3951 domain-containing protein n=1 Tax=Metabacillus litoralis TaxID=152268 RepID=UPI001CFC9785|nr:DUF3951 domain-containing protein [Metabacillus litoralis]